MTRLVLCLLYILRIIKSDDFKVKVDNVIFNNQIELTPKDVIGFPERILTCKYIVFIMQTKFIIKWLCKYVLH